MDSKFTFLTLLMLFFGVRALSQAPVPLDSADFPHPLDSVFLNTSIVPPTQTFTDDNPVNDSLTIDRTLEKALESLGDVFMYNNFIAGADKTWTVVTFYYTSLPNPNNWKKVWRTPNPFVPGATAFPSANLYYQGTTAGKTTYNFFRNTSAGFYELGSRVMDTSPYNIVHTPQKPLFLFPVDYTAPANIVDQAISTTASTISTQTKYSVTVDAYGTLELVTGTIQNPVTTTYLNCTRTVTYSVDTMDAGSGMLFYIKAKIYNWYVPGIPEPMVTYSVAQVRNNLDPLFWSMDPSLAWHDEIEMSFTTPYIISGVSSENIQSGLRIFPNPSDGVVFISLNIDKNNPVTLTITDICGNVVYSNSDIYESRQVDLSGLASGIYIAKAKCSGKIFTEKIVIK